MKSYTSTSSYKHENKPSAVALGCFDGLHKGHLEIIGNAINEAKKSSLVSVVWSFNSPPKNFFAKSEAEKIALITPINEKKRIIRSLGADIFIGVEFNKRIAELSPEDFFEEILIKGLCAKHIFCGFNYRFGKNGSGNTALLQKLCDNKGIKLSVIDEIKLDGQTVSSSAIRAFLANGDIKSAQKMLGRPYSLRSKVKDGQHLGRKLGFPTINQDLPSKIPLLKNGVYLTKIKISKRTEYGITNIGMRPTVKDSRLICETHIFDFSSDLYGKHVTVEFIDFIRQEKKFDSLDDLSAQVKKDIEKAKLMLNIQ